MKPKTAVQQFTPSDQVSNWAGEVFNTLNRSLASGPEREFELDGDAAFFLAASVGIKIEVEQDLEGRITLCTGQACSVWVRNGKITVYTNDHNP
jgi:hypothetical protein